MVKNTTGGSGHKCQARKLVSKEMDKRTRIKKEDGEEYGIVTAYLGNGMCHVTLLSNVVYLCHIRGKFKGRSKKDNIVANGKWVLVGIRDYESERRDSAKKPNCDLLEVYSDVDVERLKTGPTSFEAFVKDTEHDDMFQYQQEEVSIAAPPEIQGTAEPVMLLEDVFDLDDI